MPERDVHRGIELAEDLGRHVKPRQHAAASSPRSCRSALTSLGTVASVVTSPHPRSSASGATDDLAVDGRVERLEGNAFHRVASVRPPAVPIRRRLAERSVTIVSICCICPEARRSCSMSGSSASLSSGARTTMRATGVVQRPLLLGLLLADGAENLARYLQCLRAALVAAAGDGENLGLGRPGGLVHRPGLPPRPDFLGRKRQKRREQPQKYRRGRQERRVRGGGERLAVVAVAPRLHELEVDVAEEPEEGLGALEHARVLDNARGPLSTRAPGAPAASAGRDRRSR